MIAKTLLISAASLCFSLFVTVDIAGQAQQPNDEESSRQILVPLDYIDLTIDGLRRWRDSTQNASAKISVLNFDAWLSATDRYQPIGGFATWRGGRY